VDFVKFAEVENATRPLKDLAIEVDQTLDAYYDMQLGSSPDWNEFERKLKQLVFKEKKARNNDKRAGKLEILRDVLRKYELAGNPEENYWDLAIEHERYHVMNNEGIPEKVEVLRRLGMNWTEHEVMQLLEGNEELYRSVVQQMVDFNGKERTIRELYKEVQILALADRPPLLALQWWIKQLSTAINQLPEQDCEAIGEPQSDDERDSNSEPDLRAVLTVNEGFRRALLGFDNWRFSVQEHQMTHWTSCYDDRCFIHTWHKDNTEYFPKKQSRKSQSRLPRRGERSKR
jgi:hypothetical protein